MLDAERTLVCLVNGDLQRFPAAVVHRVSLRLPVSHGALGPVVELDGTSWPVRDERPGEPTMNDHFVFIEDEQGMHVVVVDRVMGLESDSAGNEGAG
jgi:hypothetical protein